MPIRYPATDIEFALQAEIDDLRAENERLEKADRDGIAVCDSYAAENQQFHDEILALRAENERLESELKLADRANYEHSEANRRLRGALEKIASENWQPWASTNIARAALQSKQGE